MNQSIKIGKLICSLISVNVNKKQTAELKQFNESEWLQLYYFAKSYNLTPLLYSKINKLSLMNVLPKKILLFLQTEYNNFSCSSIKRQYEIKQILDLFNKSRIDLILLKGAYISEFFYDSPTERPMCDIDILVKKEDIQKTVKVLLNAGCTTESNNNIESINFTDNLDSLNNFTKHLPEFKTSKGTSIEIHWTLDYKGQNHNTNIDMNEIWATKEKINIFGINCYKINTELHLLYLCINIAEDLFKQKILQLFDIFLIINKTEINWNNLAIKAQKWNCEKALYAVLIAEKKLFSLKIQQEAYDNLNIEDLHSNELVDIILKSVFANLRITKQYEDKIGCEFSTKNIKEKVKFFYWTFWSKEKIIYHYGIDKGWLKIFKCRIKRTLYLLQKYFLSFYQIYIVNINKRSKIKERSSDSFNVLETWLKK